MNRVIKFRGKRIDNGEWVYGDVYHGLNELIYINHVVGNDDDGRRNELTEVDTDTLGQFTGLHDKEGNDVYEGDQLYICSGYTCVVAFQDAMFVGVYSHPEDGEIIPLSDYDLGKALIIHDNPELINK